MSGHIKFERIGNIALVTLSNPRIKNALSYDMAYQLADICEQIDADKQIGCTVLRGAEGTFCSGADTSTWADTYAHEPLSDEAYDLTNAMYGSFVRFGEMKAPTIAAVRGAAVGAGLNLALAADLRVAASDARFLSGFFAAGIHPGGGFFTLVRRLAGRETASLIGLFGEELSGSQAHNAGLVGSCVDDSDVEDRAIQLAERISSDPLIARRVKRSFQLETQAETLDWATALEVERGVQLWSQNRRQRSERV